MFVPAKEQDERMRAEPEQFEAQRATRFRFTRSLTIVLLAMGAVLAPGKLWAQATAGTILGTIQDVSGAVVPEAIVTVTNMDTSISKVAQSDANGNYEAPYLIPGRYAVEVEKRGFKKASQTGISLEIDQKARVDLTLEPGNVSQTVSVSSEATLVKTETAEQAQVITSKQVVDLPLNIRNFAQLVNLNTGSTPGGGQGASIGVDNPQGLASSSVNGLPSDGNNWQIDGISDNEAFFNILTVNPSVDAIQEFKTSTSNYSAEFGQAGGANVQISIKSGTNQFHGVAFEFLRNNDLDANGFFDNLSGAKIPAFRQNQFGANLGGPIIKDRTFFFMDYEGYRSAQGESEIMTIPTLLQRQGIFTEVNPINGAPQNLIYNPTTHQPFPGNTIPVSQQSPAAMAIAKLWPSPNLFAPNGAALLSNNYYAENSATRNVDNGDVRVDHRFSDKNQFFVRYSLLDANLETPPYLGAVLGGDPGLSAISHSFNQNAVISDIYSFSPTTVNEFRMGLDRVALDWAGLDQNLETSNQVGIPGINDLCSFCGGLARISIAGENAIGHTPYAPTFRHDTIFQWVDNLTHTAGKQTIKTGANIQRIRANLFQTDDPIGEFDFDGNETSNLGAPGTGIGLASFLTGYESSAERDAMPGYPSYRTTYLGFFVQDDIRVNEKLTANVGLRYEIYTAPTDAYNRQSNFDLSSGDILLACIATSCTGGVKTDFGNWEPRAGLAYSPDSGKTAFRVGSGVSAYAPTSGQFLGTLAQNPPYVQGQQLTPPNPYTAGPTLDEGMPPLSPAPTRPGAPAGHLIATGDAVQWLDPNLKETRVYQWSAGIERALTPNLMLDANYVGNAVTGLPIILTGNIPMPGFESQLPLAQRRPYYLADPDLDSINLRFNGAQSHYNSLQVKLEKRFSSGLSFLASYTYSKNMTRGVYFDDPFDFMADKAPGDYDQTHYFVGSYSYALPFGRGKRFGANWNRWTDAALGGWQVNGITTLHSGLPFSPSLATTNLDDGLGNMPNRICSGAVANPTIAEWFNPNCFVTPALNVFGNSGYNILRGPGFKNWDVSLFKNFSFTETKYLQFRGEFFNAFNNVDFSNPKTSLCGGNCGEATITSTSNIARQIQFALKFYF